MTKSRPVIITMSILAGLQILTAGASLADIIGPQLAAFFVLLVAAAQGGVQFYVQSAVTPSADVIAYRDKNNDVAVGDAGADPIKAAAAVEALTPPDPTKDEIIPE